MLVGDDYSQYARHFRAGTTKPFQEHDEAFMREVAEETRFSRFHNPGGQGLDR
jgi:hypothetical protein